MSPASEAPTLAAVEPAERSGLESFSPSDWGLLAAIALMWGSSFIFIEEGLEAFQPPLIALVRLLFGAATLSLFPKARTAVDRKDLPAIALLGFFWMAAPFLLFPIAQQWIDSSLAGMINGGVPVFAALFAAIGIRRLPNARQSFGLLLGFIGVVTVSWPAIQGARSTALGVLLVLFATISYGVAINLAVPLQKKYGALPVLLRSQVIAIALTLIPGLFALRGSHFAWSSLAAVVPLGCLGTGIAFVGMTVLLGRVGATRASIAVYFVPVVAIALGAIVRDESIETISIIGTAMVIAGAIFASRNAATKS